MAAALILVALLATQAVFAEKSVMQQLPTSQFAGFMKLIELAEMKEEIDAALKSGSGITVFAPTDDALTLHTSPTLMAYLKQAENKETLKKVLRSHIVAKRISPFQWEGSHPTLGGSELPLSMDAQAFYAGNNAVMQYNAVVGHDGAVHSLPTLIIPESLGDVKVFVQQGSEIRRILAAAPAPALGPAAGPVSPETTAPPAPKAAPASAVASLATICLAALAALLF